MRIRFLLITEGSSDRRLVPHLEELCVRAGATEAEGTAPDLSRLRPPPGKRVADQVRTALELVPGCRLVFVHRDADRPDDALARRDIESGVAEVAGCPDHVVVIPIQELEAWLLTDESAIRMVAMNPGGKEPLGLPAISRIEHAARPKERLEAALMAACRLSGRRLKKFKQDFAEHRAILLERLDIDGEIRRIPAWQRLVQDTTNAVQTLLARDDTQREG